MKLQLVADDGSISEIANWQELNPFGTNGVSWIVHQGYAELVVSIKLMATTQEMANKLVVGEVLCA